MLKNVISFCKKYVNKLKDSFTNKFTSIKNIKKNKGYVAIILACFIPLVLVGIQYADKLFLVMNSLTNTQSGGSLYKECAREAALAVAKNWNPGLTLSQQKDAVYKVADAVYNSHPCLSTSSVASRTIPGLVETNKFTGARESLSPNKKTVPYNEKTKYLYEWYHDHGVENAGTYWNYHYASWLGADKGTDPANRISVFDDVIQSGTNFTLDHQDIYLEIHPTRTSISSSDFPSNLYYTGALNAVRYHAPSKNTDDLSTYWFKNNISGGQYTCKFLKDAKDAGRKYAEKKYKERGTISGIDPVTITIEDNKIKVKTDDQVAYATPAECNVDIVLAVPTNAASSNINNLDSFSSTSGNPFGHESTGNEIFPSSVKKTPIWQIGQACKNFVKDNFYHLKGVYMSLIPYSAKLSISPDRAADWTVAIPKFKVNTYSKTENTSYSFFTSNTEVTCGAALYATSGEKGANLVQDYKTNAQGTNDPLPTTDTPYYWGGVLTGVPIMCRQGDTTTETYGGNPIAKGLLLDTNDPSSNDYYKFRRMNLNPCYGGYANLLGMRCEQKCTYYVPNPYYVIEPTADLVKIYEMCNVLYPIYDYQGTSNFLFLPLEWAVNMLSNWTRDPGVAGSSDQIELHSKLTEGRKKAVILIINKPDWFAPNELTYLGFNNDYSEIPTVESDKIDFSLDYSGKGKIKFADGTEKDANYKFVDGSSYDGTIQGPKKILKFENTSNATARNDSTGFYECSSGSAKLTFPVKGLIKIVVKAMPTINWVRQNCDMNKSGKYYYNMGHIGIGTISGKANAMCAQDQYGRFCWNSGEGDNAYVTGWKDLGQSGQDGWFCGPVYGNNTWVVLSRANRSNGIQRATDPTKSGNWKGVTYTDARGENAIMFADGKFMIAAQNGQIWTSDTGEKWNCINKQGIAGRILGFAEKSDGTKLWITGAGGRIYSSTDGGVNWNYCDQTLRNICADTNEWYGAPYVDGYFYAVRGPCTSIIARSMDGKDWRPVVSIPCNTNWHRNITYVPAKKKFYVYGDAGRCVHVGTISEENEGTGTIQFSDISDLTNGTTTSQYTVTEEQTFYIEPDQIKDKGSNANYTITLTMNNIRLISAEITNRPFVRIEPTITDNGTDNGWRIYKLSAKKAITLKASAEGKVKLSNIENTDMKNSTVTAIKSDGTSETEDITSGSEYAIDGISSEFYIPKASFENNYKESKVKISLTNAKIDRIKLSNQELRMGVFIKDTSGPNPIDSHCSCIYETHGWLAWLINGSNNYWSVYCNNGAHTYFNYRYTGHKILNGKLIASTKSTGNGINAVYLDSNNATQTLKLPGGSKTIDNVQNNTGNNGLFLRLEPAKKLTNGQGKSWDGYLNSLYFINNDDCFMDLSNPTSTSTGVYLNSNKDTICFDGKGDLYITVSVGTDSAGTLVYDSLQNGETAIPLEATEKDIVLDPEGTNFEKHYDELNVPYYTVKVKLVDSTIHSYEVNDNRFVYFFPKLTLPKRSNVIDFSHKSSEGKPVYDKNIIVYGENDKGSLSSSSVKWEIDSDNENQGYFVTTSNTNVDRSTKNGVSGWHHHYLKKVRGDFFFTMEDIGSYISRFHMFTKNNVSGLSAADRYNLSWNTPGVFRYFLDMNLQEAGYARFDTHNVASGSKNRFHMSGFTLPANSVLYNTSDINNNNVQSDTNNQYDATEAVKEVTKKACTLLKASGARIYIIAYRKQTLYIDKVTNQTGTFDYGYLSNCVDAKSDTDIAEREYNVSTEEGLKNALNNIAADIKNWAGTKKATVNLDKEDPE